MSRTYRHEYSLRTAPADAFATMDALIAAVEASMPPACYGVGSGNAETGSVQYNFFSNRARGRRIVAQIDKLMGETGSVAVDLPAQWPA